MSTGDKQDFFDKPENIRRILRTFYGICALLFAADFLVHRHTEHGWEGLPGFYPLYGFVGCVVLVIIAKWMRTFLMRPADYYERLELGTEDSTVAAAAEQSGGHSNGGQEHV
ncbi:hypothetical protein [Microbulbifer yueqingensis]|uniref:2TM domain-containing protein n=1 Tax=Microbulbifer yueqingensis TaxID=658219 RepID=A0A1G8ZWF9_9GAMM|nr:hypothetical protein [Microbulbifer yueqingensis]SDK19428.1 hypothetical protein SAMN05216212_1772 [Microbulbifer yueqingensis]